MAGLRITRVEGVACVSTRSQLAGQHTCLHGDLLHYSYYTLDDHVRQVNFFTTIAAKDLHRRGKRGGFIKLFLSPAAKFIGDYVFRGGFLDGWHGLVIARISAHATFLKYAKLRELRRAKT